MGNSSLFNLPNILTLINLFSGCMGIVFLFNYQTEWVPFCVLITLIADFLDGFAARLTKGSSAIGKELDSLADVISFGLLPGAIIFHLLFQKFESAEAPYSFLRIYLYASPAFLITCFAALRLAKFNLDTRQTENFHGLATPAATIFVTGILLLSWDNSCGLTSFVFSGKALYGTILLLCIMMIIDLPMFGFKFKSFSWKGNEERYLFIILSIGLLATLKFAAVSAIIILYIIFSIALKFIRQ